MRESLCSGKPLEICFQEKSSGYGSKIRPPGNRELFSMSPLTRVRVPPNLTQWRTDKLSCECEKIGGECIGRNPGFRKETSNWTVGRFIPTHFLAISDIASLGVPKRFCELRPGNTPGK